MPLYPSEPVLDTPGVRRAEANPTHPLLLVLPAIAAHAAEPHTRHWCRAPGRHGGLPSVPPQATVAHSWSVLASPHTCWDVRPKSRTTLKNGVPPEIPLIAAA